MDVSFPAAPRRPDWVFLDTVARIGVAPNGSGRANNETTADDATKDGEAIEVTFSFAHPPCPSYLYVHCPNLDGNPFRIAPVLVSSAGHLALLRVDLGLVPQYFLYKAGAQGRRPELELLPEIVSSHIHDEDIGSPESVSVSPRGCDSFVLAAVKRRSAWCYELHVFIPERRAWMKHSLSVYGYAGLTCGPAHYRPGKTIAFSAGELGWADLFNGVILCDANVELDASPVCAHFVPFPKLLPGNQPLYTTGTSATAAARRLRDVTYDGASGLLWLVELEHLWTRVKDRVDVSGWDAILDADSDPVAEMHEPSQERAGWRLVTWYRCSNWAYWRKGGVVYSYELLGGIDATFRSVISSSDHQEERLFVPFGSLEVSNPTLGGNGGGEVVYVQASDKARRNQWLLAVDMRRRAVASVALVSDNVSPWSAPTTYLPSALSSYYA